MRIALDAGHGGSDPGAVYNGRLEKDDNLRLAMAVGDILRDEGYDVFFTRDNDIYETPFKKATDANNSGADYFVSFHRNSGENPNTASGVQVLVFNSEGEKERLAENIQNNLTNLGFKDLGIVERPNLVVLKRTQMPAALVETGFINNEADNRKFDEDFDEIARAIANGIIATAGGTGSAKQVVSGNETEMEYDDGMDPYEGLYEGYEKSDGMCQCPCDRHYRVQVGAFKNRDNAEKLLRPLQSKGFPAFIIYQDGLYKVQVGAYRNLDNAVEMEKKLRRNRYNTYITV